MGVNWIPLRQKAIQKLGRPTFLKTSGMCSCLILKVKEAVDS